MEPRSAASLTSDVEDRDAAFLTGLARAFGGAIVFSLPMLMTMELWWLGFSMEPLRLMLLLLLVGPLLVGLSHFIGFEETFGWKDDVVDALVAYAIGFLATAPILVVFGVVEFGMPAREIAGKVAVQAVPASIGALLAQSQFGGSHASRNERRSDTYGGELFFMTIGALFLSLNVAATDEIPLIAHKMEEWRALVLALASLVLMHGFVYSVGFRGQSDIPQGVAPASVFLRYTVVGYAICMVISAYLLWTFNRTGGLPPADIATATVVLAFPAAVGAAAARLIL